MKTLLLLRHAKSSWGHPALDDHARPLAPRGERAATAMGAFLARRGPPPDVVLCSSSRRAQQTLERVLAELPGSPRVAVEHELYQAYEEELLDRLRGLRGDEAVALLVGHNPGIGELACALAERGDRSELRRMRAKFPTAALAVIAIPLGAWTEVTTGGGELLEFVTPRDLR